MGVERNSDRTVWVVVGLIAVVAIVALVYLFSQSDRADLSRGDTAAIGENVEAAAAKAGAAAERAVDRAGSAIENTGERAEQPAPGASPDAPQDKR